MRAPVYLFGVPFTPVSQRELIEVVKHSSDDFYYVATPNVDHVVRVYRHPKCRALYEAARFSVCDSRILFLFAKVFRPGMLPEVVTGSDLTKDLFAHALPRGARIAVVGCEKPVVDMIVMQYGLEHVMHYNPPMGFINSQVEVKKAVDFVIDSKPEFTFLAVGSPQQEVLANLLAKSGQVRGVGFCVGASLLFLAGVEKRAPRWMQLAALEWVYRLLFDPRRMYKRYFTGSLYLVPIILHEIRKRLTW